ncbi:SDR family NAD(P)-dependent oxidoreductase [Microbulbifer yueqingensis]|uniref:NAD(P)-dependent dehydrogenase, short-chain alcohol dehydrogenase family n=1 Tax=Microbulbifer yueqingensis TaxID=658219 RepID=A0A1G8X8H3_9GAMM|nr:SDR family NAD(P)-dependent oxidoreductase [Microbulbifer yueqingensis]SDJ86616.1 NAD(P)-dependent dehydrogenase, short-chain alcohol dehydrogenase family [Microbulbifer yueqingensis]
MDDQPHDRPGCVLVAGAGGGIARAILAEVAHRWPDATLLTISRDSGPDLGGRHRHCSLELAQPDSVAAARAFLQEQDAAPAWVVQCCGVLHDDRHGPEKSLEQCTDDWLLESMRTNVLTHLHLAQAVGPLLQKRRPFLWASLSAKVGSIGDNGLGGWYSYRMSKAALNMLVRNLSIEWGRRVDECCVVAIHPGTTDTALSKPFQENIAPDKLYSPETSAGRIVDVLQGLGRDKSGSLLFWDGEVLPW